MPDKYELTQLEVFPQNFTKNFTEADFFKMQILISTGIYASYIT